MDTLDRHQEFHRHHHLSEHVTRHHAIVGQAEAFLRNHVGGSVPLKELCRVTGVCERTLRNAFHRVHGVSPKRYMLRTRLNEAHKALQQQRPASVTTVATEYGFYELGRFASMYRERFGVRPSETLRSHA